VHLYHDHLECYLSGTKVAELARVYGDAKLRRARNIDYRHIIDSLVKKPMAFYHSQLRDAMLPNEDYRQIWLYLSKNLTSREASKTMVILLNTAAKHACESALGQMVINMIDQGQHIDLEQVKMQFCSPSVNEIPELETVQHSLSFYNQFMQSEVQYAAR
jgi:lipoprotein NlpI